MSIQRYIDPTDRGLSQLLPTDTLPRQIEWLDQLRERQMRHGICSAPQCQWPIATWCGDCRAKLCYDHLAEHRNTHARERIAALRASGSEGREAQHG